MSELGRYMYMHLWLSIVHFFLFIYTLKEFFQLDKGKIKVGEENCAALVSESTGEKRMMESLYHYNFAPCRLHTTSGDFVPRGLYSHYSHPLILCECGNKRREFLSCSLITGCFFIQTFKIKYVFRNNESNLNTS